MMVTQATERLIETLVDGHQPLRPLRFGKGMARVAVVAALTMAMAVAVFGLRGDLAEGQLLPLELLLAALFLVVGLSAAAAVVAMANPQVGNRYSGWRWPAALLVAVPIIAAGLAVARHGPVHGAAQLAANGHALECLAAGSALGLFTALGLTAWLRRGAPSSPSQAGWLTGIASGGIGIFAYGLSCPIGDFAHLALAHSGVVGASALLGRLAVPPLIRW